jgi:hypothetical protein
MTAFDKYKYKKKILIPLKEEKVSNRKDAKGEKFISLHPMRFLNQT